MLHRSADLLSDTAHVARYWPRPDRLPRQARPSAAGRCTPQSGANARATDRGLTAPRASYAGATAGAMAPNAPHSGGMEDKRY